MLWSDTPNGTKVYDLKHLPQFVLAPSNFITCRRMDLAARNRVHCPRLIVFSAIVQGYLTVTFEIFETNLGYI